MAIDITLAKSAANVIGTVDDLLIQIMLCLPVKSLMRFKLVSKQWKSLITSHRFSLLRFPSPSPVLGLISLCYQSSIFEYIPLDVTNPTEPPFSRLKFPGDDPNFPYWIHQSCNGLLLCCYHVPLGSSLVRSCYVYNPTTKCSAQLPRPGITNDGVPMDVYGANLAFDPAKSPFYKVICVRRSEHSDELLQIEVYSSESGAWRVSGEPFTMDASLDYGVYWNGWIHWIDYHHQEVICFDADDEYFETMSLPATFSGCGTRVAYFGESSGHLHIVEHCGGQVAFDVYEMKSDCSEWFVVYRVDMTVASECTISGGFSILALTRVEGKGSFLLLRVGDCKVIRLYLDCNTLEECFGMGTEVIKHMLPRAWEHIECLAGV